MRSREPAMPWLPASRSACSAVSMRLRSTPSSCEEEASTSSGSIRLSRNSAFSRAIDSVSPITTESVGRIAQLAGSRPLRGETRMHVGAEFDRVGLGRRRAEDHVGPARGAFRARAATIRPAGSAAGPAGCAGSTAARACGRRGRHGRRSGSCSHRRTRRSRDPSPSRRRPSSPTARSTPRARRRRGRSARPWAARRPGRSCAPRSRSPR